MYRELSSEQDLLPGGIATETLFDQLPLQPWPAQWHSSPEFPTPQSVGSDEFSQVTNDAISFGEPTAYRLGESSLPVATTREHFVHTVKDNQTVVAAAETGSGKSSQFGLYLLEAGYPRVFVTQPRIVAARELMHRARHSLGAEHAHLAGYLTGTAADSDCGPDARLIYVTEELLLRMANRGALRPDDVIMNDEAHERTMPTIFLLEKVKELLRENPDMRQIISSATIDTDRFARYAANSKGEPAPVLILPGRTHPITHIESDKSVDAVMKEYIAKKHNVLAFEPGISRMLETQDRARGSGPNAGTIHLLYGDQSPAMQKAALNPDKGNHVVSSRIGETSITPQGKDVSVDSGLSNVGGYKAGVRTLTTVFSSRDTMKQRAGRVGRTQPGIYVVATPRDTPPPPLMSERDEYEMPQIQSGSVARYIAELLLAGKRIEDLDLLESPTEENVRHGYRLLKRLGALAMEGDDLVVTDIGRAMIDIPLDEPLARMLVESRRTPDGAEGPDHEMRLQVAAAAAVQQVNGILNAQKGSRQRYLCQKSHQEKLSTEQASDVLFQLDVFTKLYAKQQEIMASGVENGEQKFENFLLATDILPNRYFKAMRTFQELCRREKLDPLDLRIADKAQRKQIVACQIVGAEELFVPRSKLTHRDTRGDTRSLGAQSTVHMGDLHIGTAFDLEGLRSSGNFRRRFIVGATAVSTAQLLENVPERISRMAVGYGVTKDGSFAEKQALYFDDTLLFDEIEAEISPAIKARTALLTAMMTGSASSTKNPNHIVDFKTDTPNAERAMKLYARALELDHRSRARLNVSERYLELIDDIVRRSLETTSLDITDPAELDQLIPAVYMSSLVRPNNIKDIPEIIRNSPDAVLLRMDEDNKRYLPVTYRSGIAYVTVPRDLKYAVNPSDFAELQEHHDIKLRVANAEYQFFDVFFNHIEEQRQAPNRQKRIQRREEIEAAAASGERTPDIQQERVTSASRQKAREVALGATAIPRNTRARRRTYGKRESNE